METLEELKRKRAKLDKQIEVLERTGKPIERFQRYYLLTAFGGVTEQVYDDVNLHINRFGQGNVFHTEEEAELEAKRRNLLHRFKMFRDKCNEGWKPDFGEKCNAQKYLIGYSWDSKGELYKLKTLELGASNLFNQFGYFKNRVDCDEAIELFGDEIKNLFIYNNTY